MAFGDTIKQFAGRRFLRVKDDQPVEVTILGDERIEYVRWNGQGFEVSDKGDRDAVRRGIVNVWDHQSEGVMMLEGPQSLFFALFDAVRSGLDLSARKLSISRSGSGKSTRFHIEDLGELSAGAHEDIASAELYDLIVDSGWDQTAAPAPQTAKQGWSKEDRMPF